MSGCRRAAFSMLGVALAAALVGRIISAAALAGPFEDAYAAHGRADYATAQRLFRQLADQGDASAQFNLGVMYDEGRGVPQNDGEAVKWYRKAAEQGLASAQSNLGFMYAKGQGAAELRPSAHVVEPCCLWIGFEQRDPHHSREEP